MDARFPLSRCVIHWLSGKWRRRPRIVSHDGYARLFNQLPAEQRKNNDQRAALKGLNAAHRRERLRHREAISEKEELKTLLAATAPDTFQQWLGQRRETHPQPSRGAPGLPGGVDRG